MSYPPAQGGPADWRPKKKRTGLIVTLVLVVVLAIGGGGVGVWLWQGSDSDGGGAADDPSANLPANADLAEMAFPDPNSFGYADGPEAMCPALNEKMSPRGYLHVSGERSTGTGMYCRFITPGLSLMEDGSNGLRVDIGVWKDNAVDRYAGLQEQALSKSESQQNDPEYTVSQVERFPVGDAGYIFHREGVRTDTEAFFRSGEYMMVVSVWGSVLVSGSAKVPETKPLPAEVTYREITDIMTLLNGDGEPGPSQITKPELAQNPALDGTAELVFPDELTPESVCTSVASATESLGLKEKSGRGCGLERKSDDWRDHGEGYTELKLTIQVKDFPPTKNLVASEELARDARAALASGQRGERKCGSLYALPFADTGYAVYCGSMLNTGFVLNGRIYIQIEYSGYRVQDGDLEPLPEGEVMGHLVTMFTAMAKG